MENDDLLSDNHSISSQSTTTIKGDICWKVDTNRNGSLRTRYFYFESDVVDLTSSIPNENNNMATSQRVMNKGPKNVVSDALSRLPEQGDIVDDVEAILSFASMDEGIFPIQLQLLIQNSQSKDRSLRKRLKENPNHYKKKAIENVQVITYKDRIFVPKKLRNRALTWYHHYLCHPGRDRMYKTMAATLYWDNMETDVSKFTKTCPTCQRFKKSKKKNGKLPPKEVTMIPWETVCIDLISPCTVTDITTRETNYRQYQFFHFKSY